MSRSRAVVAAAVLGLALALAACNGDSSDGDTSPEPSSSASTTPADDTASEAPSEDASPTVTPASGPLLTMPNATINAPKGYKHTKKLVSFSTDASSPDYISSVTLTALSYAGPTLPLDLQFKAIKSGYKGYQRLPDEEIDGATFLHLSGVRDKYNTEDLFSVRYDGYETTIRYKLDRAMKAADREQLIAEGLASFHWR